MKDLIERLEKATGPDRELDEMIRYHTGSPLGRAVVNARGGFAPPKYLGPSSDAPLYTASIDAALTLVPEGLEWVVNNRGMYRLPGNTEWNGWAGIYGEPFVGSEGATPAIALCIAALKARQAITAGDRQNG